MVQYIKQFVEDILNGNVPAHGGNYQDQLIAMAAELSGIDARDFEPAVRTQFLHAKSGIGAMARRGRFQEQTLKSALQTLVPILDAYRGPGSWQSTRSFPYILDTDMRRIIERDYAELTIRTFPSGAWKGTVIMAGSILEAILHDVLSNPTRVANTNATPHAQSIRGRKGPVENGAWDLVDLMKAAAEPPSSVLTQERADTIDQVLRDYRNFVHPKKEIRAKHECNEAEAGLAKYCLDGVCDHLERTL